MASQLVLFNPYEDPFVGFCNEDPRFEICSFDNGTFKTPDVGENSLREVARQLGITYDTCRVTPTSDGLRFELGCAGEQLDLETTGWYEWPTVQKLMQFWNAAAQRSGCNKRFLYFSYMGWRDDFVLGYARDPYLITDLTTAQALLDRIRAFPLLEYLRTSPTNCSRTHFLKLRLETPGESPIEVEYGPTFTPSHWPRPGTEPGAPTDFRPFTELLPEFLARNGYPSFYFRGERRLQDLNELGALAKPFIQVSNAEEAMFRAFWFEQNGERLMHPAEDRLNLPEVMASFNYLLALNQQPVRYVHYRVHFNDFFCIAPLSFAEALMQHLTACTTRTPEPAPDGFVPERIKMNVPGTDLTGDFVPPIPETGRQGHGLSWPGGAAWDTLFRWCYTADTPALESVAWIDEADALLAPLDAETVTQVLQTWLSDHIRRSNFHYGQSIREPWLEALVEVESANLLNWDPDEKREEACRRVGIRFTRNLIGLAARRPYPKLQAQLQTMTSDEDLQTLAQQALRIL